MERGKRQKGNNGFFGCMQKDLDVFGNKTSNKTLGGRLWECCVK
jgi:hypothetical protein